MPYPATADPGEGESSTLAPVFPSANAYQSPREEEERSRAGPSSSSSSRSPPSLLPPNRPRPLSNDELRRRAVHEDDAGAQVDLRIRQDAVVPTAEGADGSSQPRTQQRLVPPKGWLHFVAGGIGGMCGAIITSPLDVVKTRLQSDLYKEAVQARTSTSAGAASSSGGFMATSRRLAYHFVETGHLLREISTKEGPRALFKGLGPTLVGVVPARSINFFTYGNGKLLLAEHLNGGREATWIHLLAAASAGVVTATATNPIWVVKTRLQLEGQLQGKREREERRKAVGVQRAREQGRGAGSSTVDAARKAYSTSTSNHSSGASSSSAAATIRVAPSSSSSFFQGARSPQRPGTSSLEMTLRIIRTEGVAGLYKGMSASYLGVAEGTIQWVLYEYLKRISGEAAAASGAAGGGDGKSKSGGGLANTVSSAGLAKLTASLITYPHEVVRTRLRQDTMIRDPANPAKLIPKYRGLVQTCLLVFREEGAASLYGGLSAHLLRVVPNAAVMFSIYEVALRLGSTRVEVSGGEGEAQAREGTSRQV